MNLKNLIIYIVNEKMAQIHRIEFSCLKAEEVRKNSVLQIVSNDLFEKGVPKSGGLCDLRLGTIDREYTCHTCNQTAIHCPGHFGHLELAEPMINILFLKYITKVINCICLKCSQLLSDNIPDKKSRRDRLKTSTEICKGKKKCIVCDFDQPKIVLNNTKYYIENKDGELEKLSNNNIQTIFNKISKTNLEKLGFDGRTHPSDFIMNVFPVNPPQVRPSIMIDASIKSQDDLTYKLVEIIKTNNLLINAKKSENSTNHVIDELTNLLQYHITTFIDNSISSIPQATQRTGRPIKAVVQRLKSKDGRIRGNLMGKRVDFSGRSVITAEPSIDLNQLGIPHKIAQTLTYPEKVTKYNFDFLQSCVNNGPNTQYGVVGAKYIFTIDGTQKDLRFIKDNDIIKLNIGDTVERHLKDNDIVVFNRQPSLHKFSMNGHYAVIMPHSTFRMNLSATLPYNADFDGDEMNLHVPQSEMTKAEVKELMMIDKNIITSQSNKPIVGIIQDALLGSYKLTSRDTFLTKYEVMHIMMKLKINMKRLPIPAIHKPVNIWTGKQIFDLILPNINFYKKSQINDDIKSFSSDDSEIIIKKGKHICGQLCKRSLGATEGGIIHIIWLDYGPYETNNFISQTQYCVNTWLQETGFSIGACDIFANEASKIKVDEIIKEAKNKVNQIIKVGERNSLTQSAFESQINQVLNNAVSQTGREVDESTKLQNNIKTTVAAGSKGSILNIAQIMGCVG